MASNGAADAWMMTRRQALGLALALPLIAGDRSPVAAAEPASNTWTYAGNPARTGVFPGPGPDLSGEVVERWRIDGLQTGYIIQPCGVYDGIIYYRPAPDGITDSVTPLIAVDAATGAELWRRDPPVTEPPTFFYGEPAIADGLLVMPTFTGLLMGIDARTGEERWVFDVQGISSEFRPAIVDGVVYLSDPASVNAIKLGDTPEWLWKMPLGDGTTTVVSGTVSVDGDAVIAASIGPSPYANMGDQKVTDIHVLNAADGAESYRYQSQVGGETYQLAVQDGNVYGRADKTNMGRSHFFSMTLNGTERWSFRTSETGAAPVLTDTAGFFVAGTSVYAFDPATGETLWTSELAQLLNANLVLIDDVIYAGALQPGQTVYAVSATDGTLLSSIAVPFEGARAIGITNGTLFVSAWKSLVALGAPS